MVTEAKGKHMKPRSRALHHSKPPPTHLEDSRAVAPDVIRNGAARRENLHHVLPVYVDAGDAVVLPLYGEETRE